jgi:hypothetical protein
MTFITCEFSGGPWTSAVQGAKLIKIFLTAKNAEIAEKKRDLLPRKGTKERKKDGGIEKRKRGILTAKYAKDAKRTLGFGLWALGCRKARSKNRKQAGG